MDLHHRKLSSWVSVTQQVRSPVWKGYLSPAPVWFKVMWPKQSCHMILHFVHHDSA